MDSLLNYNLKEIQLKLNSLGLEPYRAKQVFTSLMQGKTFDECSNLSKEIKTLLNEHYLSMPISIFQKYESADGTVKFLYKLTDNNIIEGVLMKYKYGYTLCVSTQVGCAMGCAFCASTIGGLVRNLTAGEILGQVIVVNRLLGGRLGEDRKITNVVLMGSGEPLNNYNNVTKFIDLVSDVNGLNMSQNNISLSTCGIVPNIYKLADDGYKITLTVSLHAPTDEIRKSIMKIANAYTILQVLDACRYYYSKTKRRIVFEYILIKGVNDSFGCANTLAKLLSNLSCHVNLIPLNEIKDKDLKTVSKHEAYAFADRLMGLGISATVRRTLGDDVEGACGQLRRSYLTKNESDNPDSDNKN